MALRGCSLHETLLLPHFPVFSHGGICTQQELMRPLLNDPSLLQHDDLVGPVNCAQPVGSEA